MIPFNFMVCRCSFRSAEEEEKYGSYCQDCWNSIKEHMKCVLCNVPVQRKRLYVDRKYQVPICKECYTDENFDLLVNSKYIFTYLNKTVNDYNNIPNTC